MGCFGDSPDYAEAARQQGAANREAAITESQMNNPDVYAPGYNVKWLDHVDPVTGIPGRPTKEVTLGPDQQQIWQMQQDLMKYATSQMQYHQDRLGDAFGTSYTPGGLPAGGFDPRYQPNEYYQTEAGIDAAPGLYSRLDYSYAPGMPSADRGVRDAVTQNVYDRGSRLLDTTYDTRQQQVNSRLSNQGIFTGSDAYSNAQGGLQREREQAYNDLAMRAVEAGGAEMARDYGLQMQGRQQGVNELTQQGQFANQARGQMVDELLKSMSQKNVGINQAFNTALAQANLYNQGRQQYTSELQQDKLLPINAMLSLFSGQQLNLPQAPGFTPTQIAPPPIYQGAKDQGNYDAGQTGQALQAGASVVAAAF